MTIREEIARVGSAKTPDDVRGRGSETDSRDEVGDERAEDKVRRVERQLAVVQQLTHIGSWEWDMRTNTVAWSDELYRIYGLEPQSCEITFESFLGRLHPEDRGRVQGDIGAALERGGRFAYPERILRPDGSLRVLDTVGEVARDPQGNVVGLIGTCRDVTDERKRDEKIRLYADIVRDVQIGLCVWKVEAPDDVAGVSLLAFNPAAEEATGLDLSACLGRALLEIFPAAVATALPSLITDVARDGRVREANEHTFVSAKDPSRTFALKAFPLPAHCVGLALDETTAQTLARKRDEAEQRTLEMIASGAPLADVLRALVLVIEELAPPTIASILLVDPDGIHMRHGAAPHLPEEFNRRVDGEPMGPSAGSCGTAAYLRRPVIVTDIETDPLWDAYRPLAQRSGLRACWSTPILATDGRVVGTFALYFRAPRAPTESDRELTERATHIAGIAIERRMLEHQLRELSAHVESVREDERTGIAREIHDELGQSLTALKMDLAWIGRRIEAPGEVPRALVLEKVQAMSQMTDDVIHQVRRISAELRPGVLDDLGLLAALEWQGQEFEKRTGVPCVLRSNVGDVRFDRNLSTAVFRIFQEALTNITRHADAKHVDVRLDREAGSLRLDVCDDGRGITIEEARSPKALGLLGISERARRLGGTAQITRRTDTSGTIVSLVIPVAEGHSQ